MFTETELRDALEHSAGRADRLDPQPRPRSASIRRPGPWLAALAAAATVAALAVGLVALTRTPDRPAPSTAAPLARVDLVDRAVAGTGADVSYSFADVGQRVTGGEHLRHDLGAVATDGTVMLTVLPGDFASASTIERGRRVSIAGTTGWFALRTTYLLDGQAGGNDKPLPFWTIAFRTPSGDWAFAQIDSLTPSRRHDGTYDDTTVKDPARIIAAYDDLHVRFVRDAARQPLRFAALPHGLRLSSADLTRQDGRVSAEWLNFQGNAGRIDVTWSASKTAAPRASCSDPADLVSRERLCSSAKRTVSGGTLTVVSHTKDRATARRVLDGTTVATGPADYVGFGDAVTP